MSQFQVVYPSGVTPPTVPLQFTTDAGTAVPAANNLDVKGKSSTENNANGVIVKGGTPNTPAADEMDIVLTNRVYGSVTTVDAATETIVTFSPTVIGTYVFEFRVAAFNTTNPLGSGTSVFGAIRYDGADVFICDLFDEINNDEGAMSGTDIAVIASGASMELQATGYAGQTINWAAVGLYTFVGA